MTKPCRVVTSFALMAAAIGLSSVASAQTPIRVAYDVEFTVPGTLLQATAGSCASAGGTDKLTGTLWGYEPAPAGEDVIYYGRLVRFTDVNVCDVRTLPPGDRFVPCSMNIVGRALVHVELQVGAGGQGAYLQAQDTGVVVTHSSVQGTCDPVEMARLQNDFGTMSTAGSPDGQPIELPGLPAPAAYPQTFAAKPPESIWTLTILARRP